MKSRVSNLGTHALLSLIAAVLPLGCKESSGDGNMTTTSATTTDSSTGPTASSPPTDDTGSGGPAPGTTTPPMTPEPDATGGEGGAPGENGGAPNEPTGGASPGGAGGVPEPEGSGGDSSEAGAAGTASGGASFDAGPSEPGTAGMSMGGAPNEAGVGGSSSGCAGLPFCDDFEAYDEGEEPDGEWRTEGGGSVEIDATFAYSGEKSVHIQTGESEQGRVWLHTETEAVFPTRHVFGRMRMFLVAVPTEEVHWDMIEGQGVAEAPEVWDDPFEVALRYGGQLDEQLLANFETPGSYSGDGPSSDCAKFSETPMPEGYWACMEWEFDSDEGVMRFWLDGEAVDDLEVHDEGTQCISDGTNQNWYYPTFESMKVGWREWWEAGERELWIDDVALGPERVGCD